MSRRDHTSSRLKGHDPGRNQCPVFCQARGRSEATRGNWGIQKQPILVYTQSETQGKSHFLILFFFGTSGGRNAWASGSGRCFQITCFFSVCARAIKKMSARPTISLNIGVCLIWQNYTLPFQFINFIRKVNDLAQERKLFCRSDTINVSYLGQEERRRRKSLYIDILISAHFYFFNSNFCWQKIWTTSPKLCLNNFPNLWPIFSKLAFYIFNNQYLSYVEVQFFKPPILLEWF